MGPNVVHVWGHLSIGRALIRAARELGVPVVATNHFMPDNLVFYLRLPERAERALPHLVHDGENGYTFEPGDIDALASRLAELLSDEHKQRKMGSESLKIVARHDIEETLAAFEELYELAMTPRRADFGTRRRVVSPAARDARPAA